MASSISGTPSDTSSSLFNLAGNAIPGGKMAKSNPLSQRINRVLHASLDDAETQDALAALSTFYTKNDAPARRNLKSNIEEQVIHVHEKLLGEFSQIHRALLELDSSIASLESQWGDMDGKLRHAYKESAQVLRHTQDLKTKSEQLANKKLIADAFLKRFVLSDDEKKLLTTNAEVVDQRFFDALRHLQQIRDDCQVLLVNDNQTTGVEIMNLIGSFEETAYDKLFRWVQAECRLMKTESAEVTVELKQGMIALRQRPVLFQKSMEEISMNRKTTLIRAFQEALSVGGPGGFPRPIEFFAHDAVRYVGDMVAWVHQTTVSEREMLEGLFGLPSSANRRRSVVSPKLSSPLEEMKEFQADEELLLQILDETLEGLIKPLQSRIDSVCASGLGAITAYKVAGLIHYYGYTIGNAIGKSSKLAIYLENALEMTLSIFMESLKGQAEDMLRFVPSPSADLQPSVAMKDAVSQLKEIILSYDGSMVSEERRAAELESILSVTVEPLLQLASIGARQLQPLESAIYLANCYYYIQSTMASFPYAEQYISDLDKKIETQVGTLVEEQFTQILSHSGLGDLYHNMKASPPLALNEKTNSRVVRYALSQLDTFLVTVPVETAESLERILSADIARRVTYRGFKSFVEAYKGITEKILDPANKYEFASSLITRSVAEVETLLSLDDFR